MHSDPITEELWGSRRLMQMSTWLTMYSPACLCCCTTSHTSEGRLDNLLAIMRLHHDQYDSMGSMAPTAAGPSWRRGARASCTLQLCSKTLWLHLLTGP